jgi:hypothetical protein
LASENAAILQKTHKPETMVHTAHRMALTPEEARRIAVNIARLPELPKRDET